MAHPPIRKGYKDLIVWRHSMDLVIKIYAACKNFPKEELFGLTSQMRRSAISIPSNIAEGSKRGSRKDFRQFILIAYGSAAELQTQVELARRLDFLNQDREKELQAALEEIMRMLHKLARVLAHTEK